MLDLNHKSILITGGTGSFGKAFTEAVLTQFPKIKRLIIFSRDEQKQYQMAKLFSEENYPQIQYSIGNVKDYKRLRRVFEGIDIVIHAAAIKHVPIAELNPDECIKTNIGGAENVIDAALDCNVQHVIALSTGKAAAPINLYGATKLASEKLFIHANALKGNRNIKFSIVRYGNVMGSRGSVIPFFLDEKQKGVLPITDKRMTRFTITSKDSVAMVLKALETTFGGEIFVPKSASFNLVDVAKAIAPNCTLKEIGIRPGEKLHEELITTCEALNTYDLGDYYVILPQHKFYNHSSFIKAFNAKKVSDDFNYASNTNTVWENVDSLKALIKTHVNSNFSV